MTAAVAMVAPSAATYLPTLRRSSTRSPRAVPIATVIAGPANGAINMAAVSRKTVLVNSPTHTTMPATTA